MKALSIKQPWAWLIVNGYKDVENRTWRTKFRGKFFVHASKNVSKKEFEQSCEFALKINPNIKIPSYHEIEKGGIVGVAEVVDCKDGSFSPWYMGEVAFLIGDATPIDFVPMNGKLNFFNVDKIAGG